LVRNSRIGFFFAGLPMDLDLKSLLDFEALGEEGTEVWATAGSANRWAKEGDSERRGGKLIRWNNVL
jgi:hypothetical protein